MCGQAAPTLCMCRRVRTRAPAYSAHRRTRPSLGVSLALTHACEGSRPQHALQDPDHEHAITKVLQHWCKCVCARMGRGVVASAAGFRRRRAQQGARKAQVWQQRQRAPPGRASSPSIFCDQNRRSSSRIVRDGGSPIAAVRRRTRRAHCAHCAGNLNKKKRA